MLRHRTQWNAWCLTFFTDYSRLNIGSLFQSSFYFGNWFHLRTSTALTAPQQMPAVNAALCLVIRSPITAKKRVFWRSPCLIGSSTGAWDSSSSHAAEGNSCLNVLYCASVRVRVHGLANTFSIAERTSSLTGEFPLPHPPVEMLTEVVGL